MNMNEVNESWWMLSLISIKIGQFPWTAAKDTHNKERIWRVSVSGNSMDVDKVTSQRSDIYYQDEKAGVWSELQRRGGSALHVFIVCPSSRQLLRKSMSIFFNNIPRLIHTLELLKWICLLGSFLPRETTASRRRDIYSHFPLHFPGVRSIMHHPNSRWKPSKCHSPIVSDSQETPTHRRAPADKQKDSINKRVRGGNKQPRRPGRLICFTAGAQEQNTGGNSLWTQLPAVKSAHKHHQAACEGALR